MVERQPLSSEEVTRLLEVNTELLCAIQQEANQRKNKNLINASMASLIYEYERNLMRLCSNLEPGAMGAPDIVAKEKVMFHRVQVKKPQPPQKR